MGHRQLFVLVLASTAACGPAQRGAEHPRAQRIAPCPMGMRDAVGDDLTFECVATGIWMFTARAPADFERPAYPANGLMIEAEGHAILVDTAWSDAQAEAIAAWSALPITAALVTHFHEDRTGGIGALICEHECPACTQAEELGTYVAECRLGACVVTRTP